MIKPFYNIAKNDADTLEIDIEGMIGGIGIDWGSWEVTSDNTKEHIKKLVKEVANSKAARIIVNINSYGGFVNDGISIHDILAEHKGKVTTRVMGHTASAATIIAQAGNTRAMSANALYLIHRAGNVAMGNVNQIKQAVSDLEKVDNTIINLYAKRSGKTVEEITDLMDRFDGTGEWLTAQEALAYGLIDEIIEPTAAWNMANNDNIIKAGLPGLPTNKISISKISNQTDTIMKDKMKKWFDEFMAKVTNKPAATEAPEVETPAEVTETPKATPEVPAVPETSETPEPENTVRIADMEEVRNQINTLAETIEANEAAIAAHVATIAEMTAAAETTRAALAAVQDELARAKAGPTATKPINDPALDGEQAAGTNEKAAQQNAKALRGE